MLKVRTALTEKCTDAGTNEKFHEKCILDIVNTKNITVYMTNFAVVVVVAAVLCVFQPCFSKSVCSTISAN